MGCKTGVHKCWTPGRPRDPVLFGGAKYFQHNYYIFFCTYKNVYQYTCTEQKAPDNKSWGDTTLFRVLSKELASCQPSGAWNLEVAPRFLENLWKRGVKYVFECFVQFLFVPIDVLERYTRCRGRHACVIMPASDCSKISVLTAPRRTD